MFFGGCQGAGVDIDWAGHPGGKGLGLITPLAEETGPCGLWVGVVCA